MVAIPVLLAAFAWAPAAHAAGPGISLPAVPAVSTPPVVSTVRSVTQSVTGRVSAVATGNSAAAAHVVKPVATAITGTATPSSGHTPTETKPTGGTTKRAVPSYRDHGAAQAPKRPAKGPAGSVARQPGAIKPASPAARLIATIPGFQLPAGFFLGASAGGGSGFALVLVALAAALSALPAPGLGRRLMPSLADGSDCALTLDLERPD